MATSDEKLQPITRRPTVMKVRLGALEANFHSIQRFVGAAQVMPIVKANAYGHGLVTCARHLQKIGARWMGVAFLEEAIQLRRAGITVPILAMGGIPGNQIPHFIEFNVDLTASSIDKLSAIDSAARAMRRKARVHLKIDTGMERIGVHSYNAEKFFEVALRREFCEIVGVYSHLAPTRKADLPVMRLQLERFLEAVSFFEKKSIPMPIRHLANSAGMLGLKETHLDLVRPGLALYGVYPLREYRDDLTLEPAMSLHSQVVYFKVVPKGAGVGYDWNWKAPRQTRIVTIPIGYGDGYFKRLSNCGRVLIRGKRYPIVGNVCMDQFMVDIGDEEAYNGDEVVLIGEQGKQRISVEAIAELIDSSPHEVLVSTNLRVPRVYE